MGCLHPKHATSLQRGPEAWPGREQAGHPEALRLQQEGVPRGGPSCVPGSFRLRSRKSRGPRSGHVRKREPL